MYTKKTNRSIWNLSASPTHTMRRELEAGLKLSVAWGGQTLETNGIGLQLCLDPGLLPLLRNNARARLTVASRLVRETEITIIPRARCSSLLMMINAWLVSLAGCPKTVEASFKDKRPLQPRLPPLSDMYTQTGPSRTFQNSDGNLWVSEVVGCLCEVEKPGVSITASPVYKDVFIQLNCSSLSCLFSSLYPVPGSISISYSQPHVSKSRTNIMPTFSALGSLYTSLVDKSHPTESFL